MSVRLVIIGGGPGGNQAATHAARLGAEVTLIERDVVGGAAHLWDCIPSKTMIATGGAVSFAKRIEGMGLEGMAPEIDPGSLRSRISGIVDRLQSSITNQLISQGIRMIHGTARITAAHEVTATHRDGEIERLPADAIVIATGTRPRIPDWVVPDGERILTTRDCYPPSVLPSHICVVGSGVTGVEFVHMFSSLGSKVTLVVSRQQVLPQKDPEVAAVLEEDFLRRGVRLLKGARAESIVRTGDEVVVTCDDGRIVKASHAVLAIGSIPNTEGLGLEEIGVKLEGGYVTVNHHCQSNVKHVYAAGDVSGKLPLSSVASMQGREVAKHAMGLHTMQHRHLDYDKAASAIFTEPEIADVGLAEAEAFASGRKIRVTKVPFSASAKALINNDSRGFIKIVSDPLTGVVLGGSIVGRHAAELISVIALAVTAGLKVSDIAESMLVHPALSEALAEAAE
jgi:dihydrolipoamide dehydrogenase